jgi:hypothetical protein
MNAVEYSPGATKKDGRILMLAAAIITGLRLARDPTDLPERGERKTGCK